MTMEIESIDRCANPRCRQPLQEGRLWLSYCDDLCAWGHKEKDDAAD